TLCADCRSGTSISPDALELIRRIMSGDLAAVLRDGSPAGAGEVMAVALESIEVHFGKQLRATRSTPPLSPPSPAR
ncbi:MAG TPA: hypothetical protein VNT80_01525, partial [Acidimicrobiales bacterium]|nr:hypothetical protein [Acidimicrobiales bacterium]